jgi:rRNA maturation RNase YbeY
LGNTTVIRETKGKLPRLPFGKLTEAILGKHYSLTIVFPTVQYATNLHKEHKGKPGPANILSFPYSKKEGEIYISLFKARTEAKKFGYSYENYLVFLLIHGMCHLKGHTHGYIMEKVERQYRAQFGIKP